MLTTIQQDNSTIYFAPLQSFTDFIYRKAYAEILFLAKLLMVTNREKRAGLLPQPEKPKKPLSSFFENTDLLLSVKLRAGLHSPGEIEQAIPILNQFPEYQTRTSFISAISLVPSRFTIMEVNGVLSKNR
jgi:hypothetical protein